MQNLFGKILTLTQIFILPFFNFHSVSFSCQHSSFFFLFRLWLSKAFLSSDICIAECDCMASLLYWIEVNFYMLRVACFDRKWKYFAFLKNVEFDREVCYLSYVHLCIWLFSCIVYIRILGLLHPTGKVDSCPGLLEFRRPYSLCYNRFYIL